MSTTAEHYARADFLVERADAQLERLLASANRGLIGGDELTDEVELIRAQLVVASVHATLATVTE